MSNIHKTITGFVIAVETAIIGYVIYKNINNDKLIAVLQTEKNDIVKLWSQLNSENLALNKYKDDLKADKIKLDKDKDNLKYDKTMLRGEISLLNSKKSNLENEKFLLKVELDKKTKLLNPLSSYKDIKLILNSKVNVKTGVLASDSVGMDMIIYPIKNPHISKLIEVTDKYVKMEQTNWSDSGKYLRSKSEADVIQPGGGSKYEDPEKYYISTEEFIEKFYIKNFYGTPPGANDLILMSAYTLGVHPIE